MNYCYYNIIAERLGAAAEYYYESFDVLLKFKLGPADDIRTGNMRARGRYVYYHAVIYVYIYLCIRTML